MNDSSSGRIAAALRDWISTASPGAQLPPTREVATRFAVGPVTVQQALRILAAQGLVETRPGVGTFVTTARHPRPHDHSWQTAALGSAPTTPSGPATALRTASPEQVALHSGYPDRSLLPERLVRSGLARAARSEAAVGRAPAAGSQDLRSWFAAEIAEQTPAGSSPPTPSEILILPGSQLGLGSVFRAVAGRSNVLLVESPTYWGAILAAAQAGLTLVPIPTGPDGPDPVAVDRAFAETGARGFYAQPSFANPTGALWSRDRADAVLAVVREYGAFLIEDDWAHDFGITATPTPLVTRDDHGHVVYLRSLTKSVSPAVRVAAVVARGPLRDRLLADLQARSMYVSGVLQAAALDIVTQPGWRTHLRGLRGQLRHRRDLMHQAVTDRLPTATLDVVPTGGLNLWVRLPDGTDLVALARHCEAAGVLIAIGDEWFPTEPTGAFLRLSFAGADPGGFGTALGRVAEALDRSTD